MEDVLAGEDFKTIEVAQSLVSYFFCLHASAMPTPGLLPAFDLPLGWSLA